MSQVWYVAYGSNLALARFRCYLRGGCPTGGLRRYPGCRDPRDPVRTAGLHADGDLVFASTSSVWGGGMAFFDPWSAGTVACRAYLVSSEQFADVAAQEMRRPPGGDFAVELAGVLEDVEFVQTLGPGPYETIVKLGLLEGAPLLTVTHADVSGLVLAAPSASYLRQIAIGLREAHGWDASQIGSYLAAVRGAEGSWHADGIADLARAVG